MKLSKTGWNNVIIFTVMSMILLINLTNGKLFPDNTSTTTSERPLLGEHAVILTLAVNDQILIERIGQTWRAQPAMISGQTLEQMMHSWRQLSAVEIAAPTEVGTNAMVVTINIAGQEHPTVLSLYPLYDQFLIYHHHDKKWLSLPAQLYPQLIPFNLTDRS